MASSSNSAGSLGAASQHHAGSLVESYFTFLDLSPEARVLYTSPSVKECVGYDPEEVYGTSAFSWLHPDEIETMQQISRVNLYTEKVGRMVNLRVRHKDGTQGDGGWVDMAIIVHVCFDIIVIVLTRRGNSRRDIAWQNSAEDVVRLSASGQVEMDNWNYRQELMAEMFASQFDAGRHTPKEPRTCLVLDRFTLKSTILFATPVVEMVLDTPAAKIAKCSLFDFMSEASKDEANRQIQRVKATEHLGYLSFDWISSKGSLIQCDAILTIAWDGKCTMRGDCTYSWQVWSVSYGDLRTVP